MPPPVDLPTDRDVVGLTWDQFLDWFRIKWRPGQHIALIGPTGAGKSTFAVGILEHRRYVLALDPKGGDTTLSASGYQRLAEWPPPSEVWDAIAEGAPARFIVGFMTRSIPDRLRLIQLLRDTLEGVFEVGGFSVYVDEFQLLADRKMMNLAGLVEELLIAARDRAISVITSYQAPAWVPTAASRQATWIVLWPTRDIDVVKKCAAIIGRDWRMVWEAMLHLPVHHVLVAGRDPYAPLVITKAPRRR